MEEVSLKPQAFLENLFSHWTLQFWSPHCQTFPGKLDGSGPELVPPEEKETDRSPTITNVNGPMDR